MTDNSKRNIEILSENLSIDKNFDLIRRDITIGGRAAAMFFADAFTKDEIYEKMMEFFFKIKPDELNDIPDMKTFSKSHLPYVEVAVSDDFKTLETAVLTGQMVLIIEGISGALMVDTREYPVRSIEEPEKDRSIRGAKDGFVETMIFNAAMIRRRIRTPDLRMEYIQIGDNSKLDVALAYIDGKCDEKVLNKLRERLKSIKIKGLSMSSQALAETLIPTSFFNPFPKIRYTERPDFASACILEGKIAVIVDNAPNVMIFEVAFSDFSKEADDYYFSPIVGTYVRISRIIISLLTVLLTPVMLLLLNNPHYVPEWLSFIKPDQTYSVPMFAQFLILEFIVDGMRLASLNTPNSLSNSMGVIAGLLLSEFAIETGWFSYEAIIYISFVAIASYSQPSFEMGYAMKFARIFLLILTQIFGYWGLIVGVVLVVVAMGCTKTLSGRNYLYPIIPFNALDFFKLFIRTKINKNH